MTGASRGIGRAIALRLAAGGRDGGRQLRRATPQRPRRPCASSREAGGTAVAARFDVGDAEAVRAGDCRTSLTGWVGLIFSSTTRVSPSMHSCSACREEDWERALRINLTGVFHCTKAALRPMVRARYGRIVNLTSVVAEMGNAGQAAYAAAKAGVIGFTKSVAREVASRGITVNAVAPGLVETEMTAALATEQKAFVRERHPGGPHGDARGGGRRGRLSRLAGGRIRHRARPAT